VPADDKPNAQLIVSQILLETMRGLGPCLSRGRQHRARELQSIRRRLAAEG